VAGRAVPRVQTFVVERYLPALTPDGVQAQAQREAGVQSSPPGVRHLRTTYLCDDELCFSLFEAPSIEVLRRANELSGMPYERITEVVDVTTSAMRESR
jgi:hypothetical protein